MAGKKEHIGRVGRVERVKTARGRSTSSVRWLRRQLNDPYVAGARRHQYRSRAAFKLMELDERFGLLKPGRKVIDLGAAPGSWSQVAAKRVDSITGKGTVVSIDLLPVDEIPGVDFLRMDFLDESAPVRLHEMLGDQADIVMSDMAANSTGHRQTDHLRVVALCEVALSFARDTLKQGGTFLAKVLQGGTESGLLAEMKRDFSVVKHAKPRASRADSAEIYVIATGFRRKTPV